MLDRLRLPVYGSDHGAAHVLFTCLEQKFLRCESGPRAIGERKAKGRA
jgi:hypothetical protein